MSDYCNFCYQPLRLDAQMYQLYCPKCHVAHNFLEFQGIICWNFIKIRNKNYCLVCNLEQRETILYVYDPDTISPKMTDLFQEIVRVKLLKNLTPKNIESKIKTLLTFS